MILNKTFSQHLQPPPPLSLSQWAEKYAYLSAEAAAVPGKWRAYAYQVGIMDALTDPRFDTIVFMKSTRTGYTKIINHSLAYHIHYNPCSQMVVQPTVDDAEGYSKEEVAPMARDTPVLRGLIADPKSKNSNNTILRKIYPGGFMVLTGANSARGFRRLTVKRVYFDEVDAYPPSAGVEGDQIKLGSQRTTTFWDRKIVIGGTPTIKNFSKVERHFALSDKRYYFVPCPFCNTFQVLRWKRFIIPDKDPARAHFKCKNCNQPIEEHHKEEMIAKGRWQPTAPGKDIAGFHIWGAYSFSPKTTWPAIAKEFLESKNDPALLKTFINTVLGETWEDKGDGVEVKTLKKNKEAYEKKLDMGALIITAGADIQKDRIELEVVAWGQGFESWSLEYIVVPGDPHFKETWQELDQHLQKRYFRADGLMMRIHTTFIDSGYATGEVYKFCYPRQSRRVYAAKGEATTGKQLISLSKKKYKRGLALILVATISAKDKIFSCLQVPKPGPGFCHFPDHYGDDYFLGLTAEQRFTKMVKGVATYHYKKVRTRNEQLDCRVYALAACEKAAPVWDLLAKNLKKVALKNLPPEVTPPPDPDPPQNPPPETTRRPKKRAFKRQRGFVNAW